MKFRLLTKDDIEVKVKQISEKGAVVLLYKTARTDMDILDESLGPEKWECDYREIKGNLYCGIGVITDSGIVWKWDCGIESREDDEGNQKKGEASDAFKRAGFKWGIGRELYTAPFTFIPENQMNIRKDGNRYKSYDTFSVAEIDYTDRRISKLVIVNNKTGKVAFTWSDKQRPESSKEAPAVCGGCGKKIRGVKLNDGQIISAADILKLSKGLPTPLCYRCLKESENG